MNIRKKVLFNPSHIKSNKPDNSDHTTVSTKNSAILEQSKTFRVLNHNNQPTKKQRNYLRTLSKQLHRDKPLNNQDEGVSAVNKRSILPSFRSLSNQNFLLVRKSIQERKFLLQQDQLPSLVPLKRPQILSSQYDRKVVNFPSSIHVNNSKQLYNEKKQSSQNIVKQNIIENNNSVIQKRKQKLNSLNNNPASFYTTYKSITLSKYSIVSKQSSKVQNENINVINCNSINVNRDKILSIQRGKEQQIIKQKQQNQRISTQLIPQDEVQQIIDGGLQESIAEQIERSKSMTKTNSKLKTNMRPKITDNSNDWSATLKSSFTQSSNNEQKEKEKITNKSPEESSLYQSEQIDENQIQTKKRKQQNYGQIIAKLTSSPFQLKYPNNSSYESSVLCQSYHIETPQRNNHNDSRQKKDIDV